MFGVTHNQYYYYFTLATSESEAPNDKSFDNLTKLLKTHFELRLVILNASFFKYRWDQIKSQ